MSRKEIGSAKSISYIVSSAMNFLGIDSDKYHDRYTVVALEYFSEHLNMFYMPNIAVKHYDATASNVFQFPPDYVDYTKVGVNVGGEVWTLGLNKDMLKPRKEACGERIFEGKPKGGYYFADHYYNGNYISGLYGIGGGWNTAYFTVDKETNTFAVAGGIPKGEIILEYISSGVKRDGSTMVPLEAVNCVRQHIILAHYTSHRREYGPGDVQRQEQKLLRAEELLDFFYNTPTISEVLDIFYESYHRGVKR